MKYPNFLKTPEEMLEWIISRKDIDPRLSQIRYNIPEEIGLFRYAKLDKGVLITYIKLCNWIADWLKRDNNKENLYKMIEFIYQDIVQNNYWGFIYTL